MCGIFGYIGHIDKKTAEKCLETLAHRGPDGAGLYHTEKLCLGHRRLAILDLSLLGKQPMRYADDRYTITYNGEIYNFLEIKKELRKRGYTFRSETDTEIILASYAEWREKCLEKFNGMWAFAIWDNKKEELFLSRDRFGKKPLFYSFIHNEFAFASEMKAITPLFKKIEPDLDLIKNAKSTNYESTEKCLIKDIKRFPAGHYGYYKNGQLQLNQFWCTLDHLVDVPKKYEDQVALFRELFKDACRIRMRSDVPIGTALSGGLDSSSVISMISNVKNENGDRLAKNWQNAFVASFPGTPLDESRYAEIAARHIGVNPKIITIDPSLYIKKIEEYLYLFEENYNTSPIPFVALYGAMRENNIFVTLDGHGPDESFGGYGFDLMNALNDPEAGIKESFNLLSAYYDLRPQNDIQFKKFPPKILFYLKHSLKHVRKKIKNQKSFINSRDSGHANWNKLDCLNKVLYISTHETILPTLLRNYDRYSMINGVEIRMPFMDHRIISFAFSLPWNSKIRNGYSKAIIRDGLADFMPKEIAYRKIKIGFNTPIVDWMQGPLKEYFLNTINSKSFKESSFIDSEAVFKKINGVVNNPNSTFRMGAEAWSAISPYLWEQSFLKRIT